jgi:hypothetical protein
MAATRVVTRAELVALGIAPDPAVAAATELEREKVLERPGTPALAVGVTVAAIPVRGTAPEVAAAVVVLAELTAPAGRVREVLIGVGEVRCWRLTGPVALALVEVAVAVEEVPGLTAEASDEESPEGLAAGEAAAGDDGAAPAE